MIDIFGENASIGYRMAETVAPALTAGLTLGAMLALIYYMTRVEVIHDGDNRRARMPIIKPLTVALFFLVPFLIAWIAATAQYGGHKPVTMGQFKKSVEDRYAATVVNTNVADDRPITNASEIVINIQGQTVFCSPWEGQETATDRGHFKGIIKCFGTEAPTKEQMQQAQQMQQAPAPAPAPSK